MRYVVFVLKVLVLLIVMGCVLDVLEIFTVGLSQRWVYFLLFAAGVLYAQLVDFVINL